MALGGLPGAPGPPRARVKKPKNPYFLQGPTERPSSLILHICWFLLGRACSRRAMAMLFSAAARWGFSRWGFSDLIENRSFWGSGRSRAAGRPFKKVGGFAPHLFKGVSRPPGAAQTPK